MTQVRNDRPLDRRQILIGAGALGAATTAMTLFPGLALADKASLEAAIKSLIGDTAPSEGRVELELPQIAENGNTVPFSLKVESAMTEEDYVKAVHVFAEGNPNPDVATFRFTPACGEAKCSTRMRLAKSQRVVALAEMSNGDVYMAKTEVKVTIGGCGG